MPRLPVYHGLHLRPCSSGTVRLLRLPGFAVTDLTTLPLSVDELARVKAAASALAVDQNSPVYRHEQAEAYVRLLLVSGMHPSVLSNPRKSRIATEISSQIVRVIWERPKKKGKAALCSLSLPLPEYQWVMPFIEDLVSRPVCYDTIKRLLHAVGARAGVVLSARRLRHTCAVHLLRAGVPSSVVQDQLNVSPQVLRAYGRYLSEDRERIVQEALASL